MRMNQFDSGKEQISTTQYLEICKKILPMLSRAIFDPDGDIERETIVEMLEGAGISPITNLNQLPPLGTDSNRLLAFLQIQASGFSHPQTLKLDGDLRRVEEAVNTLLVDWVYTHCWETQTMFDQETLNRARETVKKTNFACLARN